MQASTSCHCAFWSIFLSSKHTSPYYIRQNNRSTTLHGHYLYFTVSDDTLMHKLFSVLQIFLFSLAIYLKLQLYKGFWNSSGPIKDFWKILKKFASKTLSFPWFSLMVTPHSLVPTAFLDNKRKNNSKWQGRWEGLFSPLTSFQFPSSSSLNHPSVYNVRVSLLKSIITKEGMET